MRKQLNPTRFLRSVPALSGVAGVALVVIAVWIWLAAENPVPWGYLTLIAGLVLLGVYLYQNRGYIGRVFTRRRMFTGFNAAVLTIAVIGIIVLLNIIVGRHHWRLDLTRNSAFSLSSQTLTTLEKLNQDIKITVFSNGSDYESELIKDLLTEYDLRSGRVAVNYVDPDKQPSIAKQYEIMSYNTVVLEAGERKRNVLPYNMFEYDPYYQTPPQFKGEQAITQALIDLTETEEMNVYFLEGHGERSLGRDYAKLGNFIRGESFSTASINIASVGSIPEEADLLLIAGPQKDLMPKEISAVEDYLAKGGRVFVALDPSGEKDGLPGLKGLLAKWGVGVHDDVVVDPARQYFIDPLSPIPKIESHPITDELINEDMGIVLPRSRSLFELPELPEDVETTVILKTSDEAWGETNLRSQELRKEPEDVSGPLTLGLVATRKNQPGKLLVVGSSSFLTDDVLSFQGNVDFFMNALNWLLEREDNIYIRAKDPDFATIRLSGAQMASIRYGIMLVLPLAFLLLGGTVWFRRRNL